ncbi:MAG: OapB/ArvB family protein [Candidatus Aenigmatarchaeota archaeon]
MKLKLDFVSSSTLDGKPRKERINYILSKVKDGSILVMDGVMSPDEELDLIRETMRRVDDGFPGIEVCSLKKKVKGFQLFMEKLSDQTVKLQQLLMRRTPDKKLKFGITLVGPAKYIKKIKKNPNSFSVLTEV